MARLAGAGRGSGGAPPAARLELAEDVPSGVAFWQGSMMIVPRALPSDRRPGCRLRQRGADLRFCCVLAGHDWSDHWLTGVPAVRVASVTTSTGCTRRTVVLSRRGAIRRRGVWTGAWRRMRRTMVGLHREPGGSSRQRRAGLATNGSAAGPKGAAGFSRGRRRRAPGVGAERRWRLRCWWACPHAHRRRCTAACRRVKTVSRGCQS